MPIKRKTAMQEINGLKREIDDLREGQSVLMKAKTKNARRDNLVFNILGHMDKEMWAYMLIISVTCGFALGVFLINIAK